jgi:CBS-domain-containing membrane protein
LSKNQYGKEYESVNYTSWLENAETSAIGRALANFNYAGSKRPSREEMQKVEHKSPPPVPSQEAEFLRDDLLAYLQTSENIVGKANADKLRESIRKHEGDAAWLKQALDRTIAEVKRQEGVLAVDTTPAPNPLDAALGKLGKTVDAKAAGPQPELTLQEKGIYDHE